MITIEETGVLVSADSKPWEMEGRKGVSHRMRILLGNEIYPVKCSEDDVLAVQSKIGAEHDFVLALSAPKERISFDFVRIV